MNRACAQMNRESSRSHLIMSIVIESTNLQTQNVTKGKLSFVDLAGSERYGSDSFVRVNMGVIELHSHVHALHHFPAFAKRLQTPDSRQSGLSSCSLMRSNVMSQRQDGVARPLISITCLSRRSNTAQGEEVGGGG